MNTGILLGGLVGLVLHEAAHVLAARLIGLKVKGLVFNRHGVGVRRERGTPEDTALIAAAGPLVNLLLAALFAGWPDFQIANLLLAAVNLLPLPNSDGSKVLHHVATGWHA